MIQCHLYKGLGVSEEKWESLGVSVLFRPVNHPRPRVQPGMVRVASKDLITQTFPYDLRWYCLLMGK